MSTRPIAYVMEQTLGSITHYLNLKHADEAERDSMIRRWIPIEYVDGKLPWTVRGGWLARRALSEVIDEVDGVFMHTMTLALGSADLFFRKPTIISSDGPAMAKRGMRAAYGDAPQLRLSELAKRALFRRAFKRAAGFVAWSDWAKQSFVEDYGCREQEVAVIPPGVDLQLFAPGSRDHVLPRLLFVGGDFVRKGGDLLLKVFRKALRGRAELVLVTRSDVAQEPGVTVYRNLSANSAQLLELYASCDVFVLPTRADCYSLVCMEALAAGMPVVTTRVGGIPDLIREGETGHLIDVDDEEALRQVLSSLALDAGKRREMGLAARADAQRRFGAAQNAAALFDFVRSRC